VLELRDGRVLVNDGTSRRLLVMDTSLKTVEVLLDSLTEVANTYGTRAGTLMRYRGDSALFIDPTSLVMIVLDPEGKIARVRSVWRAEDVYAATQGGSFGSPGIDAKGRIVYRIYARPAPPKVMPPPGMPWFPVEPDSAFIVAVDINTRKRDTLGSIRIPKQDYSIRQTGGFEGGFNILPKLNPLPVNDEWAVLSDGVVAFIRARDYRIDYLNADGTWTSSAKLPFDWQRLSDEDKQKLVDSVKTANQRVNQASYVSSMIRWVNQYNKPYPPNFTVPAGYIPQNGFMKEWKLPPGVTLPANYIYGCPSGVDATELPGGIPSCIPMPINYMEGMIPPAPTMREVYVIPASELPDYRPPFPGGSARADLDGNLWIRTILAKPVPGGPVYDVISRQGELVDRIQLPPGYTIVGFGRGRVVYLSMRDPKGVHIARVRLK
jgi:hypothetical protein